MCVRTCVRARACICDGDRWILFTEVKDECVYLCLYIYIYIYIYIYYLR